MIDINDSIKQELIGDVNNLDILVLITKHETEYRLSTKSQVFDDAYYDDLITKISGFKQSVDIKSRKVKFGGSSISISNAQINGKRFSDSVGGDLNGARVLVYVKTPNAETYNDLIPMAELKVSSVKHDDKILTLQCEDAFIDEFHKELPLSKNTLYENINTFVGDNEKRIPILYGHLKQAPAVVYFDSPDSPLLNNSVTIAPDKSFKDDIGYEIEGIKPLNPHIGVDGIAKDQLIDPEVLNVKLGSHAAIVYSEPPVRLNRELVEGLESENYIYSSKWESQFEVSEDRSHIKLLTESDTKNSSYISSGNFLCGEVSKLIGAKTYKTTIFRPDNTLVSGFSPIYAGNDVKSYSSPDTMLDSTLPISENFDKLSKSAVFLDSSNNGKITLEYNTIKYVQANFPDIYSTGNTFPVGALFNFDIPSVEFEFEPMKSSASKSKGIYEDSLSDANLIMSFNSYNKNIFSSGGYASSDMPHLKFCFYPAQSKTETDDIDDLTNLDDISGVEQEIEVSSDILGVPEYAYGDISSNFWDGNIPISSSVYGAQIETNFNWDSVKVTGSGLDGVEVHHPLMFTARLDLASPISLYTSISNTGEGAVEDYRHPFYTPVEYSPNNDPDHWSNRLYQSSRTDWLSQNIYTCLAFPQFLEWSEGGDPKSEGLEFSATFSGMFLKRSWYQKEVFNERFFVNAKGKYKEISYDDIYPGYPQAYSINNYEISFSSKQVNADTYDIQDEVVAKESDKRLFILYDYLTNESLKYTYHNGERYEIVLSEQASPMAYDFDSSVYGIAHFDIDVNSLRAENDGDRIIYKFNLNSKVFRNDNISQLDMNTYFNFAPSHLVENANFIVLRYAKKNVDQNGRILSWEFLDEKEDPPKLFSSHLNESLLLEKIALPGYGFGGDDFVYFSYGENEIGQDIPTITSDKIKSLIVSPSEVAKNIIENEFFPEAETLPSFDMKNVSDKSYRLDFSINETQDGLDVMSNIAKCSNFIYCPRISSGGSLISGINHAYDINDVDKKIDVHQIIKYNYSKTAVKDVALKVRVKYGYDYVKEEYTKVTPDVGHDSLVKQSYIDYYNIDDEETYTLEHEAPYIQDRSTAEILAKHLFELHKNQHINVSFQLPLMDSIELEVGDIVSFTNSNGSLTNIDNTKPYGFDLSSQVNFINDQAAYSFFMITSIKKDLNSSSIEVTQLHYLNPHSQEEANPLIWDQGDQTDTNTLPTVQILNAPSVLSLVDGGGLGSITLGYSDQDANDSVVEYAYKVTNTNGDILLNYDQTRTALDPLQSIVIFSLYYNQFGEGTYNIFFKVYDSTGAGSNPASITTNVFDFAFADPSINLSTQAYNSSGEIILANAGSSGRPGTVNVPHNPSWMMIYATADSNLPNDEMTFDWDITPEPIQQINYPSGNVGLILEPDTTYTSICTGTNVVGNSTEVQTTINVGEEIIEEPLVLSNLATELVFFEDVGTHVGWSIRQDYEFYYREEDNSYHIFKDDYESFIEIRESLKETKSLLNENILIWTKAQYPEYGTLDPPEDHYSSNTYQPSRDMNTNMPSGEYWGREIPTYSRNVSLRLDWAFTNEAWMSFYSEGNPIARYVNTLEDGATSELNLYVHPYMTSAQFLAQEEGTE